MGSRGGLRAYTRDDKLFNVLNMIQCCCFFHKKNEIYATVRSCEHSLDDVWCWSPLNHM